MWTQNMKDFVTRLVYKYHRELTEHGYDLYPIKEIKFTRAIKTFGTCTVHFKTKDCTIAISERCFFSGEGKVKNTILHELCHDIKGTKGHGYLWQRYAKEVGRLYNTNITQYATKEECANSADYVKERYNWEITCTNCGHVYRYVRQTKVIKAIMDGRGHSCRCGACHCSGKLKVKNLNKNVKIYGVKVK